LGSPHIWVPEKLNHSARLDINLAVDPDEMRTLSDQEALIRFLREDAQKCSEMYEDQGTFALLVKIMLTHEKMAWLLRSSITLDQYVHEK
jgi:DNA-binding ferritin-like protein